MEVDRDIARFREEKMRKIHEREKEKKDVSILCWTSEAKDYFSQGHELLALYVLKFFRGSIKMYLHFMSFLHIDMTQVVEILPHIRSGSTYST